MKKPMHSVSSEYFGNRSLVSGSMWTKEVDSRTPPPKQRRQDNSSGCLCLAASEKHAGNIPEKNAPKPNVSMDIARAVVMSIFLDYCFTFRQIVFFVLFIFPLFVFVSLYVCL